MNTFKLPSWDLMLLVKSNFTVPNQEISSYDDDSVTMAFAVSRSAITQLLRIPGLVAALG